ncbi:hypothetical protein [Nocardia xishanensis]|uniref:hypothetical protein n=1 Tax=Nocardia xishanensis TaxID=238964 RepID=UPI0034474E9F
MDASVFFALLALVCGLLAVIAATVWWPVPGEPPGGESPLGDAERRVLKDSSIRHGAVRVERPRHQRLAGRLDPDAVPRGAVEADARAVRRMA